MDWSQKIFVVHWKWRFPCCLPSPFHSGHTHPTISVWHSVAVYFRIFFFPVFSQANDVNVVLHFNCILSSSQHDFDTTKANKRVTAMQQWIFCLALLVLHPLFFFWCTFILGLSSIFNWFTYHVVRATQWFFHRLISKFKLFILYESWN